MWHWSTSVLQKMQAVEASLGVETREGWVVLAMVIAIAVLERGHLSNPKNLKQKEI